MRSARVSSMTTKSPSVVSMPSPSGANAAWPRCVATRVPSSSCHLDLDDGVFSEKRLVGVPRVDARRRAGRDDEHFGTLMAADDAEARAIFHGNEVPLVNRHRHIPRRGPHTDRSRAVARQHPVGRRRSRRRRLHRPARFHKPALRARWRRASRREATRGQGCCES